MLVTNGGAFRTHDRHSKPNATNMPMPLLAPSMMMKVPGSRPGAILSRRMSIAYSGGASKQPAGGRRQKEKVSMTKSGTLAHVLDDDGSLRLDDFCGNPTNRPKRNGGFCCLGLQNEPFDRHKILSRLRLICCFVIEVCLTCLTLEINQR